MLFPDELIFDEQIDENTLNLHFGTKVTIPKKGDKKKMIDLCRKNAEEELTHYFKLFRSKVEKTQDAMDELSNVVGRKVNHIEVFDNAQLFGTAPISGMIVWKDHHFERKMYRKFHLKTTTNDDYQAMKEVVYRRYQRALIEQQKLPDLICVDGGKGQVSAALEVVDALSLNVPVLGLKKDQYHRLEGYVFNGEVHLLDKKGNLFQVLSKLSEEVHRFTITFHRETKNRKDYQSVLDHIPGLGKTRKKILLATYTSLDDIKHASIEDLRKLGLPDKVVSNQGRHLMKTFIHEVQKSKSSLLHYQRKKRSISLSNRLAKIFLPILKKGIMIDFEVKEKVLKKNLEVYQYYISIKSFN